MTNEIAELEVSIKKKDQESIEFNQVLFETIITGIIVSFYFGAKSYVVNSVSY